MRLPWLADVLRDAGCRVVEIPGWRGRGRDLAGVHGVVWHHTATPGRVSNDTVRRLLRDGRPDLPGPLCQLGLERDGTFVVVADGRGNHNGHGTWGNNSIGIEAYNDGVGEPWPRAQLDAFHAGTAAILRRLRLDSSRMLAHRETDPRRKIDPAGIDMHAARARVARLLRPETAPQSPPAPPPPPAPVPNIEEGPVYLIIDNVGIFAVVDGVPAGFPSLQAYAESAKHSNGVPVLRLPEKVGKPILERLLLKTAAASAPKEAA